MLDHKSGLQVFNLFWIYIPPFAAYPGRRKVAFCLHGLKVSSKRECCNFCRCLCPNTAFHAMCHVDSMGGRDKKSLFCCSQTIIAHPLQTSGTLFGWRMSGSLQQNFCKYNGCHVSAQRLAFFRSATAGLGVTFRSKRTCAAGPANMWKFFLKCFCTGMMMNPQGEKDGSQKAS